MGIVWVGRSGDLGAITWLQPEAATRAFHPAERIWRLDRGSVSDMRGASITAPRDLLRPASPPVDADRHPGGSITIWRSLKSQD